ncbi:MAG: penicillin acylase family protein [Desulfomonile tiedjei]|uniref:Penicillin acylase family protein n=1 Tax=Desulfomonile tiedjei TaxID=2358 RepID=A0A9D6V7X9_9BACT|nr:penicillin acylase family protein [Desulfomonile tiedjei]
MNWIKALQKIDIDQVWLLRIFTAIPIALILTAGAGLLWVYFFALSLLPEGRSFVETPGIAADVRVVRDSNGIPGILGEREEDLAFVLGYVMAEDRLWQMDYLRRAGQGRLAEIMGSDYLDRDHLARMAASGRKSPGYPGNLGQRERVWIEKFVQGINKYMSSHAGKLPVEFSLLEYRPATFSPDDVFSVLHGLAWESSIAARMDPVMCKALGRLGKDRALELLPADPAAPSPFLASELLGWEPKGIMFSSAFQRGFATMPVLQGGCAWIAANNKTLSGKPLASCLVYQTLTAPGFWYRARLMAGDFHMSGAFIPGVPAAIAGSNNKVSWGCVPGPADDADLFIEKLDSDGKNYWRVDRWRRVDEIKEAYRVKRGSPVSRTILLTETGPIVSEAHNDSALSLKWTGRDGTGLFPALYALNRAHGEKDVKAAARLLVAPSMNVAWADEQGNCGIQWAGRIPVRPPGSDGKFPMPAWTGVHDWGGFFSFEELPSVTNPTDGFSVAAGGRPGGTNHPVLVSCYWDDEGRSDRIRELLASTVEHTKDSFQSLQTDTVSQLARELSPIILNAIAAKGRNHQIEADAARILSSWDFRMTRESAAAAIFGLFYQSLVEELLLPQLGEELYEGFTAHSPLTARLVREIFVNKNQAWLRQIDPEDLLCRSFQKSVSLGKSLMAADPKKWQWGEIHKTEFRHPLAVRSRFLEALYDVGPVSMPGSKDTINYAGWSQVHAFKVQDGVSLRQISDMTQPPELFCVSPMGSSAHFFSTHYKDQTSAWLMGRPFREPLQIADIRKSGFNPVVFKSKSTGTISMKETNSQVNE